MADGGGVVRRGEGQGWEEGGMSVRGGCEEGGV